MEIFSIFLFSLLLALPYLIATWKFIQAPKTFSVVTTGGTFLFWPNQYSPQELFDFERKIIPFCRNSKKSSAYSPRYASMGAGMGQPRVNHKVIILLVCLLLVAVVVIGVVIYFQNYFQNYCHELGCGRPIYRDGLCEYHYAENFAHDIYNGLEDFFGN